MYNVYVKKNVRKVILRLGVTKKEAENLKNNYKFPSEIIIEDLDVKDIRSFPGIGEDSFPSSGGEVSEDTDRELFVVDTDNSESGSERDSQRDKPTTV